MPDDPTFPILAHRMLSLEQLMEMSPNSPVSIGE